MKRLEQYLSNFQHRRFLTDMKSSKVVFFVQRQFIAIKCSFVVDINRTFAAISSFFIFLNTENSIKISRVGLGVSEKVFEECLQVIIYDAQF